MVKMAIRGWQGRLKGLNGKRFWLVGGWSWLGLILDDGWMK